jgi:hypothetical protein
MVTLPFSTTISLPPTLISTLPLAGAVDAHLAVLDADLAAAGPEHLELAAIRLALEREGHVHRLLRARQQHHGLLLHRVGDLDRLGDAAHDRFLARAPLGVAVDAARGLLRDDVAVGKRLVVLRRHVGG